MSLKSTGVTFEITAIEKKSDAVSYDANNILGHGYWPADNSGPQKTWKEGTKEAMRRALENFMNTKEFEENTYQLNNTFVIEIRHSVHTSI